MAIDSTIDGTTSVRPGLSCVIIAKARGRDFRLTPNRWGNRPSDQSGTIASPMKVFE